MRLRRNLKLLAAATATGAAVAYLMDPVAGHRRRERLARIAERRSADVEHLKRSVERVKDAVSTDDTAAEATDERPADSPAETSHGGGRTPTPTANPAVPGVTDIGADQLTDQAAHPSPQEA